VASAARTLGWHVTIVDAVPEPLTETLGAAPANWVWDQHRDHGVDLRFGTAATAVHHHRVELADGSTLDADAVVTAVGTIPNTDWLARSGLDIAGGVHIDDEQQALTTTGEAVAAVVAVGGVTRSRLTGSRWSPVGDAQRAAAALLGQQPPDHTPPTFSLELYGHELQVTGGSNGTVEFRVR
jgi:NADPH-dependent 2,4-dienoyl-CoA reductase/sulfur reductase-like enzyme